MQICNDFTCNKNMPAIVFFVVLSCIMLPESPSLEMPEMPSITQPSMPELSSGSAPYRPVMPSAPYRPAAAQKQDNQTSSHPETKSETETQQSTVTVPTDIQTAAGLLTGTADNIGLMGNIPGLFSLLGQQEAQITARTATQPQTAVTTAQLEHLLEEVKAIRNERESLEGKTSEIPVSRILRFKINGYNILDTCSNIVVSQPEQDGSFLVSGDRKYMIDGKQASESFYILFTAQRKHAEQTVYSASTAVVQDQIQEGSLLYRMAAQEPKEAFRTGNLITLRSAAVHTGAENTEDWRVDLLIDLQDRSTPL